FVPRDGQSLLDLTRLPEGAEDQVQANIVIEPPLATMPAAASRNALYGACSETDAAWAISRQRPQPLGPFAAPVSIPEGTLEGINRYFVLCTKDQAIPAALQRGGYRLIFCAKDEVAVDPFQRSFGDRHWGGERPERLGSLPGNGPGGIGFGTGAIQRIARRGRGHRGQRRLDNNVGLNLVFRAFWKTCEVEQALSVARNK